MSCEVFEQNSNFWLSLWTGLATVAITNLLVLQLKKVGTGKSFSEALILASTNPQYDKRLIIELPVQHIKTTSAEHGQNMARTC